MKLNTAATIMELTMTSFLTIWILLLFHIPTLSALALPPTFQNSANSPRAQTSLGTSPRLEKRCDNKLQNPSFETGLDPWLPIVQGSWGERGVFTSSVLGHDGSNFYFAHSNSSVDSSLVMSQTYIDLPDGASIECAAWVASTRPGNIGSTRVDVFFDDQTCDTQFLGTTGWVRVGRTVSVSGSGAIHTLAVVFSSNDASEDGWDLWLDDLVAGVGC